MWYSIACRTTLRATVWTFFVTAAAAVGHWLLWLCATPILMMGNAGGDFLRWVISFQLGLTPPYALGAAFAFTDDERLGGRHQDIGETVGFAIVGLLVWAVVAVMTYAAGRNRFAEMTGRFRFGPAERPPFTGVPTPEVSKERGDDGKPAAPDQAPDTGAFTAND
jgi:hypothetical protein